MDSTKEESTHGEPINNPSDNITEEIDNFANGEVSHLHKNGNVTDKESIVNQKDCLPTANNIEMTPTILEKSDFLSSSAFVPKYNYGKDQWSPLNTSGKKYYGVGFLKEIKNDPGSKIKPNNASILETCNIFRSAPMQEFINLSNISRPINDSLLPTFAKTSGMMAKSNNTLRETRKDGRNISATGRGNMKPPFVSASSHRTIVSPTSSGTFHKPVVHVRLNDEVKLNEVDSAWKPTRLSHVNVNEEELKTQELYKKFRGILNKLTPQKFDTLLDRIKSLEINTQERLEGIIDLVFEKAIDEPNFSEAYAAMCSRLSNLKVPVNNATHPDQCINFRALIITRCQNQFETDKVEETVLKLEKEVAECTDPVKKKELLLMLEEEQRKSRMKSVGNIRFIGELYKLKMLTSKIMEYCMKYLIDKLEEEKLECLCKLLTTIGQQIENEASGQLVTVFKRLHDIVVSKSNKISNRVRFMIQDVIELRKRKWVAKSVIDSQPKMMAQIQKEAEQQQRHIEIMNASTGSNYRRDEGNRGKRGDSRRQGSQNNSFVDSTWKPARMSVDTSKLKVVTPKNLDNIKLAPHMAWTHGAGAKNVPQVTGSSHSMVTINQYSALENVSADPTSIKGSRNVLPTYRSKGASIERSTFISKSDISCENRSGSATMSRSKSGSQSPKFHKAKPPSNTSLQETPAKTVQTEPLPPENNSVEKFIRKFLLSNDDEEFMNNMKTFPVKYHEAVMKQIFDIALDKSPKEFDLIAKSFERLLSNNVFSTENFLAGLKEILENGPDLFIDIPMLYENLGKLIAPQIAKELVTFADIYKYSENIILANQGHILLKAIFRNIPDNMGSAILKCKWKESGTQLKQWMEEDKVVKWMGDNNLEFLEDSKIEFQLLELMKTEENSDRIKEWVQEKLGKSSNEDWFMRSLIQAICEYALTDAEGHDMPQFNPERMSKYVSLITEFGHTKESREANCLFGIQQLIHRLEHPQGLALSILQYLYEQYIISLDGFVQWEKSEKEPEGKAVMLKMLTSFFTNIKEVDNEDSCSED